MILRGTVQSDPGEWPGLSRYLRERERVILSERRTQASYRCLGNALRCCGNAGKRGYRLARYVIMGY